MIEVAKQPLKHQTLRIYHLKNLRVPDPSYNRPDYHD